MIPTDFAGVRRKLQGAEYAGPSPMSAAEVAETTAALQGAGVRTLRGTFVDSAGVIRAKQVPITRAASFHESGLGASPSLAVLCADDAVSLTPIFGVIGDMRLRVDLRAAVNLGDGIAWAPIELFSQDHTPLPFCWRGALRRAQTHNETHGIEVRSSVEIEFVLFAADGAIAGSGRPAYGIGPLLDHSAFFDDLERAFEHSGLELEQIHGEYARGQLELSTAPRSPLSAADANVLARILLGRSARRHGLRVSLSPLPTEGDVGNGAHVHLSFWRDGRPLLSGGDGPYGLTVEGAAMIAGLVYHLPEAMGALAPSLLSSVRLQPNHYAGAFACWGLENREAAVRLCAATAANPRGAHVEVKCVDPSANPYVVQAVLLGIARRGAERELELPPEATVDPAALDDQTRTACGIRPIGLEQSANLDALEASETLGQLLGPELIEILVAVRRHEVDVAQETDFGDLVTRFRFAWSA